MTSLSLAQRPRFSVLLPTHNRADVLPFAIRSVLDQTERDFELLVVADGCTDGTRDVVESIQDPRLKYFDLPKAPSVGYANRNIALKQASGVHVAYAAHDDLFLPDHLEHLGRLLDEPGTGLAFSRPLWISSDGVAIPTSPNLSLCDELESFRSRANVFPSTCVAHRRDLLELVGWWPEDVESAADWILWRRMADHPDGGIKDLPIPTSLHFSANWRRSRHSEYGPMRHGLAIADKAKWWPPILRMVIPEGATEQAIYATSLASGGLKWCADMRSACDTVIARFAWDLIRETLPRCDQLRIDRDQAMDKLRRAESTNAELKAQADARICGLTNEAEARNRELTTRYEARIAEMAAQTEALTARLNEEIAKQPAQIIRTIWRHIAGSRAGERRPRD